MSERTNMLLAGIFMGAGAGLIYLDWAASTADSLQKDGLSLKARLIDAEQKRLNCQTESLAMDTEELAAQEEKELKKKRATLGLDSEPISEDHKDDGKNFINNIMSAVLPVLYESLLTSDPKQTPPFLAEILKGFRGDMPKSHEAPEAHNDGPSEKIEFSEKEFAEELSKMGHETMYHVLEVLGMPYKEYEGLSKKWAAQNSGKKAARKKRKGRDG